MTATVENNAITLSLQITFVSSGSSQTMEQICDALKSWIKTVSDRDFQCDSSSGTSYNPGTVATLNLQSDPTTDASVAGGATGLSTSIMVIGFSYLLHFLFKNL